MKVSGDSQEKDFFGIVVQDNDVIICTAQILYNALINKEEAKHVELSGLWSWTGNFMVLMELRKPNHMLHLCLHSDITLLIIDECHHTHKESVYNKIMRCYVEKKLKGQRQIPQILGLTASPGTGGARELEDAVNHVLEVRWTKIQDFTSFIIINFYWNLLFFFSIFQICANLDSVIVSTKNYTPELEEKVPRPQKTFDIVEKRAAVSTFCVM